MPRVSIVIPAYNASAYVSQAVNSVLDQTWSDHEIIVVDDGSTDETAACLSPVMSQIRYVYQNNRERSVARNTGIALARGDYIAFLDADDYWYPTKLDRQIALLEQRPDLGMVYCYLLYVSPEGIPLPSERQIRFPDASETDLFPKLALGNFLGCSSVVVRRTCLEKHGGFDPSLRYIEDWEFNLRMAAHCRVGCISENLTFYRQYPGRIAPRIARYEVQDALPIMIDKLFASIPPRSDSATLRPLALSRTWWLGAKIDYALGNTKSGRKRFARALQYDRRFLDDPESFVTDVVDYAMGLYAVTPTPFKEAKTFLDTVFSHLPEEAKRLRHFHRRALGRLHAGYVFSAEIADMDRPFWKHGLQAMMHDPRWVGNVGLWSIVGESMVGERVAEAVRAGLRPLMPKPSAREMR